MKFCHTELPSPRLRPANAPLPLQGLRVIDFSHFIAGPYCAMMLADFGAEVIKIENGDGGDAFRNYPPLLEGEGVPYLWANRNKRSLALNLKSSQGRDIALGLINTADIVIENFSTGVMKRLGLDYESLQYKDAIIYCSISAYGREGPYAHKTGFDPIVQAESGFMSMNGLPDQEPLRAGPSVVDVTTALMACSAILAAVIARHHTGKGQYVETTMIGTGINLLGNFSSAFLATGDNPDRFGNAQPTACPVGLFHTADEPIYLACANDKTYQCLMTKVLQMPDLATDPRYSSNTLRRENRETLLSLIATVLKSRSRSEWLDLMHSSGVPAGAIRTVEQALLSPEVSALDLISKVSSDTGGAVPNVALPITLSATPLADPVCAPALGAHTDDVLRELLGYDEKRLQDLRRAGVIGALPMQANV
ncbi:carnitine dehydratase [Pollutimonas nitritireducens]|uniref:Carnitine dehydratase n=1 Tax=Pollutimonas nitritireducens TaxID=2045209 RepID=A0A2N4UG30_9BURK|nr:CoA transferase [Pollutimonas nitritireducens]PLC53978.1 carnitine dehydratase [Pollutimonas nitritireducens]